MEVDYGTIQVSEGILPVEQARKNFEESLKQMEGIIRWRKTGEGRYEVQITEADEPVEVFIDKQIQIKGRGEMLEKGYYAIDYAYPEAVAFVIANLLAGRAALSDVILHGLVSRDKPLQAALGLIENFTDIEEMRVYLPFVEEDRLKSVIPINLPLYRKIYPEEAVRRASNLMVEGLGKMITDMQQPLLAEYMVLRMNAVKRWEKEALHAAKGKAIHQQIDLSKAKSI